MGCNPKCKAKFADPRPRWVEHRAHYGGSTKTKLADLRTNPLRGGRDIGEAREGKVQEEDSNVDRDQVWPGAGGQRQESGAGAGRRSRHRRGRELRGQLKLGRGL